MRKPAGSKQDASWPPDHDHPWSNKPSISHDASWPPWDLRMTVKGRVKKLLTTEWMVSFLGYAMVCRYAHLPCVATGELIVSLHCDREPQMKTIKSRVNCFPCGRDAYVGKLRNNFSSKIKNWLFKLWLLLSIQTCLVLVSLFSPHGRKQLNRVLIVVHILAIRVELQIVHAYNHVSAQLDFCVSALRTTKEFLLNVWLLLEETSF